MLYSATKYSEEDLSPDIKALSLLGFNSKSNLITINRNNVYFFWKDGIAPTYQAQIYDANKQLVFKAQSSHNFISIPSKTFKVGHEYSIKICCRFLSEMNSELLEQDLMSEQYFAIIKAEQLPIHITHLNSLALSEKAKARLAAESLALLPKWKFQALQLSETYHLDKLKQKLLYKN